MPVQVTITGMPVTITPVSANGASFVYKGQLGDGTGSSSPDFGYTTTPTPADAITGVQWQYRGDGVRDPSDSGVDQRPAQGRGPLVPRLRGLRHQRVQLGRTGLLIHDELDGHRPLDLLPADSGDGADHDHAPSNLTVTAVRADKVYDGTVTAPARSSYRHRRYRRRRHLAGNAGAGATFNDPSAGVNKPVTLSQDLVLAGSAQSDYALTNPQPAIVGTISKASAVLSLAASTSSVLLSQNAPVTITPTLTDSRTAIAVSPDANAKPCRPDLAEPRRSVP